MPDDRTVLDHLLEGREALKREVERLTAAIAELDTVIGQIGGAGRRVGPPTAAGTGIDEPVNPPGEVEPEPQPQSAPPARAGRAPAKRASARRSSAARSAAAAEPPKSIRVHVLDMLAAEDRDFGLAEIIDRVHAAGIQAHDDAVRSITTKLMKDGQVERVGRGQYRLARNVQRNPATDTSTDTNTSVTESAPAPVQEPAADTAETPDAPPAPEPEPENYTPPLNLGQPWDTGA